MQTRVQPEPRDERDAASRAIDPHLRTQIARRGVTGMQDRFRVSIPVGMLAAISVAVEREMRRARTNLRAGHHAEHVRAVLGAVKAASLRSAARSAALRALTAPAPASQSGECPMAGGDGAVGSLDKQQMPAILGAYGRTFDVDAFLSDCTLPVCAVKRIGEPVLPGSSRDGKRHERSSIHVVASDADFDQFPRQVEESIAFLTASESEVRRLCTFPGVEDITLDFGLARREVAVQCDRLPLELIQLAGSLGFDIELSQYPADHPRDAP